MWKAQIKVGKEQTTRQLNFNVLGIELASYANLLNICRVQTTIALLSKINVWL